MKILVIGSGGREHALAWRLAQSPKVSRVYVAPGNAGTAREDGLYNLDLNSVPELVRFAQEEDIHATVVGPEAHLAAGVVDAFRSSLAELSVGVITSFFGAPFFIYLLRTRRGTL